MGVVLNFPNIIEYGGIDTSDATALAADITIGKTAYVNGKKITGTKEVVWSQDTVSDEVTSINIPNGVTELGISAFSGFTSLESITIPDSVTYIGISAFHYCISLTSITIPNSVIAIDHGAFSDCTSLASITIPDSVIAIGNNVFAYCTSLTNIYYKGTEEQWNAISKGTNWNANMGADVEGGTVITYNYTG